MEAILQTEASECGSACLAMVLRHFGKKTSLRDIRRRFPTSLKGTDLKRIIDIAHDCGLRTRALRVDLHAVKKLKTPCLLHWDLTHFVVLSAIKGKSFIIYDPASGKKIVKSDELSRHFTGVALELSPQQDFKVDEKSEPGISFKQLLGHVSGLRRALSLILALSIALQVIVVLAPLFVQLVVDQVLISADANLLILLAIAFSVSVILQSGIGLLRGWSVVFLSNRLGLQWAGNVFAHLIQLPMDFFEKRHVGDVISRMGAVQAIQRTLTTSFVESIIDGLMAIVTFAMMVIYSWKLALVTLMAVLSYTLARGLSYRYTRNRTEQQLVAAAKQQSYLLESIRGVQSLKLAGVESSRIGVYDNLMQDTVNQDVWLARQGLFINSFRQLNFGAERVAVIVIGAMLALDNVFSVGMLIAYLAYKDQFAERTSSLIDKLVEMRMLRLHGERLADVVLAQREPDRPDSSDASLLASTKISVKDLSFRYAKSEPWILKECSFEVSPGESVAVVGASGSGKTTLLKLLVGLLDPESGTICISGKSLDTLSATSYRRMIGAVMQDDQLFAGSVAENIAFGEDNVDAQRVEEAARLASIHDEISVMPMGYNSLIGDMGTSLSGGQKQRVVLARALYRVPRILFLDEATSHLDVQCERSINDALRKLRITTVVVAHRPETIARADRVLEIIDGALVAVDAPKEQFGITTRGLIAGS